jgi:hypothetical protein
MGTEPEVSDSVARARVFRFVFRFAFSSFVLYTLHSADLLDLLVLMAQPPPPPKGTLHLYIPRCATTRSRDVRVNTILCSALRYSI